MSRFKVMVQTLVSLAYSLHSGSIWFIQPKKQNLICHAVLHRYPVFCEYCQQISSFCVPRGTLGSGISGTTRADLVSAMGGHKKYQKSRSSTSYSLPPELELEAPLVCVSSSVQQGVPNEKL